MNLKQNKTQRHAKEIFNKCNTLVPKIFWHQLLFYFFLLLVETHTNIEEHPSENLEEDPQHAGTEKNVLCDSINSCNYHDSKNTIIMVIKLC